MTMKENKVATREKLTELLSAFSYKNGTYIYCREVAERVADLLLQSSDLRVTLVEPRYEVSYTINSPNPHVVDNRDGGTVCEFYESAGYAARNAQHLVDWLNSKEPK